MLSFITVVHDNTDDLTRLIDSINRESQNIEYEIIVVDTGHETVPVVPDDVLLVPVETAACYRNAHYGRNVGATFAKGSTLVFVDSRVELLNGSVKTIQSLMEKGADDKLLTGVVRNSKGERKSGTDKIHVMSRSVYDLLNGYDNLIVGESSDADCQRFIRRAKEAGFEHKEHYRIAGYQRQEDGVCIEEPRSEIEEGCRIMQDTEFTVDVDRYRKITERQQEELARLTAQAQESESLRENMEAVKKEAQEAIKKAQASEEAAKSQLEKKYQEGFNQAADEMNRIREEGLKARQELAKEAQSLRANLDEKESALAELMKELEAKKESLAANSAQAKELQEELDRLKRAKKKKRGFWSFGKKDDSA